MLMKPQSLSVYILPDSPKLNRMQMVLIWPNTSVLIIIQHGFIKNKYLSYIGGLCVVDQPYKDPQREFANNL